MFFTTEDEEDHRGNAAAASILPSLCPPVPSAVSLAFCILHLLQYQFSPHNKVSASLQYMGQASERMPLVRPFHAEPRFRSKIQNL